MDGSKRQMYPSAEKAAKAEGGTQADWQRNFAANRARAWIKNGKKIPLFQPE
jgi:hypothetical protein